MASDAFEKFRRSMQIGYMEWHDGIGYDLEALGALPPEERQLAEDLVVARRAADWRDIEALDQLGSERALYELEKAARSPKPLEVQLHAAERLARRRLLSEQQVEDIILAALAHTTILNGMDKTLRLAAAYPTPAVKKKLLRCALHGHDDVRVHAAALVHFLHGGSSSHFDMEQRLFYLRFGSKSRSDRRVAYAELCTKIGVDPEE